MYSGLTTADKGTLLDVKARGAEWIAADQDATIWAYYSKPYKRAGSNGWGSDGIGFAIGVANENNLSFSDPEPVNIDLALAQIAEMESAEKPNEKCPICEYAISGCQCLYSGSAHPDRNDKKRVVFDHLYLLSPMQLQHVISLEKHWQISYADADLNAILKKLLLNSPYTEGATR